jgi:hypothetical protein
MQGSLVGRRRVKESERVRMRIRVRTVLRGGVWGVIDRIHAGVLRGL